MCSKKRKVCIIVLILIVIMCAARILYININNSGPDSQVYKYGEICTYKNINYKIIDSKVYDSMDEIKQYDFHFDQSDTFPSKLLVIGVELTYIGDEEQYKFSTREMHVQASAWTNGICDISYENNSNVLEKGISKTAYILVEIVNSGFTISQKHWENVYDLDYELVVSTYPEINIMKCK